MTLARQEDPEKRVSKFLSRVLRHAAQEHGLDLQPGGWVDVDKLTQVLAKHGFMVDRAQLEAVVANNDKNRFSFDGSGTRIRANQGHSVEVDLQLQPVAPPEILYHGTVAKFLESIRATGLTKGERHHVHLSPDVATAEKVGARRGKPVVLVVRSGPMHKAGYPFFVSSNGVWLTDSVPVEYLDLP